VVRVISAEPPVASAAGEKRGQRDQQQRPSWSRDCRSSAHLRAKGSILERLTDERFDILEISLRALLENDGATIGTLAELESEGHSLGDAELGIEELGSSLRNFLTLCERKARENSGGNGDELHFDLGVMILEKLQVCKGDASEQKGY
jgi:hypothetical protein